MKKTSGFTLVELIVVIAILGILAGIAIPVYSGYIKKANDAAVEVELSAILTAAEAANATNINGLSEIKVSSDGAITFTVASSGKLPATFAADFKAFLGANATVDTAGEGASATTTFKDTAIKDLMAKSATYTDGADWDPTDGWVKHTD